MITTKNAMSDTIRALSKAESNVNVDSAVQIAWHKKYGVIVWMLLVRNYKKAMTRAEKKEWVKLTSSILIKMGVKQKELVDNSILLCFEEIDVIFASYNLLDHLLGGETEIPEKLQLLLIGYDDDFESIFGTMIDCVIPDRQLTYINQVILDAPWLQPFLHDGGTKGFESM